MKSMKLTKRTIFLAIFLIAIFPIPIHTTTFPFNSIGHDYVSEYTAEPEGCRAIEERWAGLLIGIQTNRITGTGDFDCVEWQKGWGIDIRCETEVYHPDIQFEDDGWNWSIPAGENATVIGFGIIPLKTWYKDSFSLNLLQIRISSSGFGIDPIGKYHYPNLLMFGNCDKGG